MVSVNAFVFNPLQENTYVLSNEKQEALIIDPGCYFSAEWETLRDFIKDRSLTVKSVLLTHAHPDHVFGLKEVCREYGLIPFLDAREEYLLQAAPSMATVFGLTFTGYEGELGYLLPGSSIAFGDGSLELIEAPGHSPGSICFYHREQGFLIGGDVLFRESIGRADLPGGNYEQLLESIRRNVLTLPDETTVWPGHGPETTIGHEKRVNPFFMPNR